MTGWNKPTRISTRQWRCGYCGNEVASDLGWYASRHEAGGREVTIAFSAICPRCDLPTTFGVRGALAGLQMPSPIFGEPVEHLPDDVRDLYTEARRAVGQGAPNSAVLACRKILMHVAVEKGAEPGKSFLAYVNYLADKGYVPPDAKDWIDEIREHGNDANHEIDLIAREEAQDMVEFTAMMLRVLYEYPERGRRAKAARQARRP